MRERPILFSAPMVRAILDGRKTQTRRVFKTPSWSHSDYSPELYPNLNGYHMPAEATGCLAPVACPYGQPGERLWVRETFQPLLADGVKWQDSDYETGFGYAPNYVATSPIVEFMDAGSDDEITPRCTPSIFMPRWASRITLEITDVRVQRLQDISTEDCMAEGLSTNLREHDAVCDLRDKFTTLWESINAKTHPWDSNPWVWAVSFKQVQS